MHYYCLLLFTAVYYCVLLFPGVYYCLLLFTTVYYLLAQFSDSRCHCLSDVVASTRVLHPIPPPCIKVLLLPFLSPVRRKGDGRGWPDWAH
eukprot:123381-Pyramimonas_sp.AAC.3